MAYGFNEDKTLAEVITKDDSSTLFDGLVRYTNITSAVVGTNGTITAGTTSTGTVTITPPTGYRFGGVVSAKLKNNDQGLSLKWFTNWSGSQIDNSITWSVKNISSATITGASLSFVVLYIREDAF